MCFNLIIFQSRKHHIFYPSKGSCNLEIISFSISNSTAAVPSLYFLNYQLPIDLSANGSFKIASFWFLLFSKAVRIKIKLKQITFEKSIIFIRLIVTPSLVISTIELDTLGNNNFSPLYLIQYASIITVTAFSCIMWCMFLYSLCLRKLPFLKWTMFLTCIYIKHDLFSKFSPVSECFPRYLLFLILVLNKRIP